MSTRLKNQEGFTLIEIVTVIGVLVITSAVLLANNRLNEAQLSLNKDAVGIASAVSRARALTLQNLSDDICGYGVRFDTTSKSYLIFKDVKTTPSGEPGASGTCDNIYTDTDTDTDPDEILPGQESRQNLGNGIIFYYPDNASNLLITDVVFYSSDAKVKLTSLNNSDIDPAGMVIIQTESSSPSYKTLKITTTGQVTTKSGQYSTIDKFDEGILDEGGGIEDEEPGIIEDCIRDCSCAAGLATGGTCPDTCGGTCYAGTGPGCIPDPVLDPNCKDLNNNNTCGHTDSCGAPCKICPVSPVNSVCVNYECLPYDCTGKNCGDIADGSGLSCDGPCSQGTCEGSRDDGYQCVVDSSGLRLDSVIYQGQTNPNIDKSQ